MTLNNMYDLLQLHHLDAEGDDEHAVAQLKVIADSSMSLARESQAIMCLSDANCFFLTGFK